MHSLLTKLLNKRGIKREELDEKPIVPGFPSERNQFERWESILSGEGVTLDKVAEFCKAQVESIELQWKNLDNAPQKNERLIIAHTIYSTLLKTIKAPEVERVELEKYLNDLIQ